MNTLQFRHALLNGLILLGATALTASGTSNNDKVLLASKQLGRGINLAGTLDAPKEGEWGVVLEASYFTAIRNAGFDSIIIPIRWSAHADKNAPYQIDPIFMARVDWAVAQGLQNNLTVLLKTHHYEGFASEPEKELPRYYSIWEQIARHFSDRPDRVFFEISNEPGYTFSSKQWNRVTADVLKIIRRTNSIRTLVVCPVFGEALGALSSLELPEEERNALVRLYYFEPTEFTHQGASWINGSKSWLGRKWTGTEQEKQA
ncbi:MAG: cellulase family glycosylhydrolase, partial [Opitutaceae bacterium]